MRLTTKGRFAVTAMIDLALRQAGGPVTLAAISQRQQISLSYLEQLFGKLRRHDLVESTRGPGGGYTLGRKASDITVADIIVSVDEPIDATQCAGKENCHGEGERCMTHELWAALNAKMVDFLDSVTLQKLVDEQLAKGMVIEATPSLKRAISSAPVLKPIRVNAPNSVFALGTAAGK
ncbi:MAG: Fe-S cluster assembly transcriptional regulator IscR [Betaproteobacteria bacterium]|jgi:Rrf2 family iron-sulfur cluster assembly transcriptional regulator|uniref:Predicted transcriptional regulator n=1 Tax=Serpentinimonas maccroryi TaxID=1458426 RepID=A0A060NMP5_9BURK|nr:Fe-S cluster assembly transcriptional regulator IscR [Serpentinimonas maccroryi]MBA4253212.1 Fe-S cluster assembly transcriptional regulator IscR [Comamonadaceae bacterium]MCL5968799.1 Fe-S cluster assembly transcriptional regulator IscR [Betaproteobacteria bacterium]OYX59612.1 MAG: Fe-S cluster assembly transcriptional regulator IscR [Comamonadaceae bacterium 32-67-11]OZA91196.1 MAG: Fe-S cluster assembly transcriptional regulator IscR [Burkholderiales bacterium 34-67-9]BAO82655.1 predicte